MFTMHFDPEPDLVAAAKRCEEDVFLERYGNTEQEWVEEYGPYDEHSHFLMIADDAGSAVASSRVIMPNPVGSKTLDDASRPPWSVDGYAAAESAGLEVAATMDIATIAVRSGTPSSALLSIALYHGLTQVTRANGMRWVIMIMDVRARRLLTMLHLPTYPLPGTEPGPYLGSAASLPVWVEVAHMMDTQRRANPAGFDLVSEGIGFTDITLPDPADFALRVAR